MTNRDVFRSAARTPCVFRMLLPCFLLFCSGQVSGSDSGFDKQAYIGIGVGRASLSPTVAEGSDFDIVGESNGSVSLLLGRDFTKRFTGELVYADIGSLSLTDGSRAEFSDISLSALIYLSGAGSRRDGFATYARIGAGELKVANNPGFERDNDISPLGGIGLEYTLRSGVSARADYVYLDSEADYVSLSLLYRIGVDEQVQPKAAGGSETSSEPSSLTSAIMESEDSPGAATSSVLQALDAPSVSSVTSSVERIEDSLEESPGVATSSVLQALEAPSVAGVASSVERIEDSPGGAVADVESVAERLQNAEAALHPCEPDGCALLTDRFSGITFEIGSARLTAESSLLLDDVAGLMKAHADLSVRLQSHTDNSGDPVQNLELSKQRAVAVYQYLDSQGITVDRVSARAFGGARPIAGNDSPEGRRVNRRVELIFSR